MDGTENKSNIGANAILAVSIANLKAAAKFSKREIYRYINNGGMNNINYGATKTVFNMPYPLNCFYQSQVKFKWIEILKEHFIKTNYDLGLKKCLHKIDNIIN